MSACSISTATRTSNVWHHPDGRGSRPRSWRWPSTLEQEAIARLNDGIALCVDRGDNGTRDLLAEILEGEEEHADWLESQLSLIEQLGQAHYLAQQIRD